MWHRLSLILALFASGIAVAAKPIVTNEATVRLLDYFQHDDKTGLTTLALHFSLKKDWHVYWKNAGDSGAAPRFQLDGGELLEIQWPYPERIPVSILTNYGYNDEAVFFLQTKLDFESPKLVLDLEWLVCKVDCIPGFGKIDAAQLKASIKEGKASLKDQALYQRFQKRIPPRTETGLQREAEISGAFLHLRLKSELTDFLSFKNIFVFPTDGYHFSTKNAEVLSVTKEVLELAVPLAASQSDALKLSHAEFTLVFEDQSGAKRAAEISTDVMTGKPPTISAWLWALLFAFLGGLILNIMPCVFPVLSLKLFGLLREEKISRFKSSLWAYSLGVLVAFLLMGLLLMVLRLSGESIGWGFQLQNPLIVYALALLFFLMALNFLNFFPMGEGLANWLGRRNQKSFFNGDFGTGLLAVLVASPCTAPFMGSALGLTLLLPWHQSLGVFLFLGLGMASPTIFLAYFPKFISKLPRPGAWMETFKKWMALPLVLTALWLLWILFLQRGMNATLLAIAIFSLLFFGTLIARIPAKVFRVGAILGILLSITFSFFALHHMKIRQKASTDTSRWQIYSEAIIEKNRNLRPIFVDFTASWCITCQVNKITVLDRDETQELFEKNNVLLLRADWTSHDPLITKALASFGRNSVPLYIYLDPESDVKVLPEILTTGMIQELFDHEGEKQ